MLLPAGQIIHSPIFVSDPDVSGGPITAQCTPALVIGVKEVSADHYVPNLTLGKIAYRTLNNARLSLPADAWDVGSSQLTIEFTVEQTTPTAQQVGLFGFERNQKPSPYYAAVVNGKFQFRFAASDGSIQLFQSPWPLTKVVAGKLVFNSGTCSLTLNGVLTGYNTPTPVTLAPRDTMYFGVGGVADSAFSPGDYVGGYHDWTYHNLKVTAGVSSGPQTNETTVPFCRLLCDQPGPVHCYNGSHVFGFMLDITQGNVTNRTYVHNLTISSSLNKGPLIAVGGTYDPTFEKIVLIGGGQNIMQLGGLTTYMVRLYDCNLSGADIAYFGHGQELWARGNELSAASSMIRMQKSFIDASDTFVTGVSGIRKMVDMRDGCVGTFSELDADFEGLGPQYYFWAENAHPDVNVPSIELDRCYLGKAATKADIALTMGVGANPKGIYEFHRVIGNAMRPITQQIDPSWQVG